MKLDIVIPTRDRMDRLKVCLDSIKEATKQIPEIKTKTLVYFDTIEESTSISILYPEIKLGHIVKEYKAPNFWNNYLKNMDADVLCYLNDDIKLDTNCLIEGLKSLKELDYDGVVGFHQSNQTGKGNCSAAFGLISKKYSERFPDSKVFCLEENEPLFILENGEYKLIKIKDLYNNFNKLNSTIYTHTSDWEGNLQKIKIIDVLDTGVQDCYKIKTDSNEIVVSTTHSFPYKNSAYLHNHSRARTIKIKEAKELKENEYLFNNIYLPLKTLNDKGYDYGYVIGWFLAEGTKHNNRCSTLYYGDPDEERGYLKSLEKIGCIKHKYKNKNGGYLHCSPKIRDHIEEYVEYKNKLKYFKNKVFNKSEDFIKGIIDGLIFGDGSTHNNKCFWIGLKKNIELKNQVHMLCRLVGYDFRFKGLHIGSHFNPKGEFMRFAINKGSYRNKRIIKNIKVDRIKNIEFVGKKKTFNIEVEKIYTEQKYVNGAINSHKKFNNLYFLGNGIWTHNCEEYYCLYLDEELMKYAQSIGKFIYNTEAKLEHYHPVFTGEKPDETHVHNRRYKQEDIKTYNYRKANNLLWGRNK